MVAWSPGSESSLEREGRITRQIQTLALGPSADFARSSSCTYLWREVEVSQLSGSKPALHGSMTDEAFYYRRSNLTTCSESSSMINDTLQVTQSVEGEKAGVYRGQEERMSDERGKERKKWLSSPSFEACQFGSTFKRIVCTVWL